MTGHADAAAQAHHGPPIANHSSRIDAATSACSCSSPRGDALRLVLRRLLLRPGGQPGRRRRRRPEFPVFVAGVNTAILVTSSFTMHWAVQSIRRGNRAGLQAGLVLTILLGLAFLLTQMLSTRTSGFNTSDGAFASVFFGLTGLHGAHVFVGLSLLTMSAVRAFRGHFTPRALPRRRDSRDLLALRRHHVDRRLRSRLSPLGGSGAERFRSEADAFRLVWLSLVYFGLIVVAAAVACSSASSSSSSSRASPSG